MVSRENESMKKKKKLRGDCIAMGLFVVGWVLGIGDRICPHVVECGIKRDG